jgi:hypothetical protein
MKPYGNEHTYKVEALTSTKHRPNRTRNLRCSIKRVYKHRRRAQDKQNLRGMI